MGTKRNGKIGDFRAGLGVSAGAAAPDAVDPLRHRRQLVADLCKLLGPSGTVNRPAPKSNESLDAAEQELPSLSPRTRQTLERLLAGDSEKQIAAHLGVSRHTVHVYVKALYKGFNVCSRGELLARFVKPPAQISKR